MPPSKALKGGKVASQQVPQPEATPAKAVGKAKSSSKPLPDSPLSKAHKVVSNVSNQLDILYEPSPAVAKSIAETVKGLYDHARGSVSKEFNVPSSLPSLLVDGFDAEQIWEELKLQADPFLAKASQRAEKLIEKHKKAEALRAEEEAAAAAAAIAAEEDEDEDEEDEDGELDADEMDEEDDLDDDEDDNEEDEEEEANAKKTKNTKESKSKGKAKGKAVNGDEDKSGASSLDDGFFSFEEFERFADLAEEEDGGDGAAWEDLRKNNWRKLVRSGAVDEEDEDEEEEDEDEDDDDAEEEIDYGADVGSDGNAMYSDFFMPPVKQKNTKKQRQTLEDDDEEEEEEEEDEDEDKDGEGYDDEDDEDEDEDEGDIMVGKKKKTQKKNAAKARSLIDADPTLGLDEEDEDEDEDDEDDDNEEPDDAEHSSGRRRKGDGKALVEDEDEDAEGGSSSPSSSSSGPEQLSSQAKRDAALRKQIAAIEHQLVAPKAWDQTGESKAYHRDKDALLEKHLDVEYATKLATPITEEISAEIEEIIRARCKDEAWDDVQPRVAPKVKAYVPQEELSTEKSKYGLADMYEAEYMKQALGADMLTEVEAKVSKAHAEISHEMGALMHRLDALTNYNFTPKAPIIDLEVTSSTPALAMEETLPMAISSADRMAPQERFQASSAGLLAAKSETDKREKKARLKRRKEAKSQHFTHRDEETKLQAKAGNKHAQKIVSEKDYSQRYKEGTAKNIITKGKTSETDKISTSTAFFSRMQEYQNAEKAGQKVGAQKKKTAEGEKKSAAAFMR